MDARLTRARRLFLLLSAATLMLTAVWSASVFRQESRHSGERLPVLTLNQLIAGGGQSGPVHLAGAAPQFTPAWVNDHYCHRIECHDTFTAIVSLPIAGGAHPGRPRVAVLSRVRTFPGDVNEQRHPFDLHSTVLEGQVVADELYPELVQSLREHGLPVDERTVVFDRKELGGRVPPADSVDVAVPWIVGLPVALVLALLSVAGRWGGRRTSQVS